jgi:hypothetical protein
MNPFLRYLSVLVLVTLGWSAFLLTRDGAVYPAPAGPQFDKKIRENHLVHITEHQPDIVLMGDSMLDIGINRERLEEGLHRRVYKIGLRGSASTLWYLILKNNIVEAPDPPAYVIIFFRDSLLTVPGYRVQGRYLDLMDEYADSKDQVLIERAYVNLMSPAERLAEQYFPPYSTRWWAREKIDASIRYFLPGIVLGCSHECADQSMEVVFGDNNVDQNILSDAINAADEYIYEEEKLDFWGNVEASFLPEFIRLTRENGIQLILVQMKTRRFSSASPEPAGLEQYKADLAQYLAQNNVMYFDFSTDPRIDDDFFYDPLHFTEEGRDAFTDLVIEALQPHLSQDVDAD